MSIEETLVWLPRAFAVGLLIMYVAHFLDPRERDARKPTLICNACHYCPVIEPVARIHPEE
jgi:hypothetical protein